MKTTGNNFRKEISQYFNEFQIQALKDVILYGGWGDADVEFNDGTTCMAYGFCTNDTSKGDHFKGREVTKVWSEIAKVIKNTDAGKFMAHKNDYISRNYFFSSWNHFYSNFSFSNFYTTINNNTNCT